MLKAIQEKLQPFLDHPWVVSVSTGVDSMVLLDLVRRLNHPIVVVHFNHQKRIESNTEAEFIQSYCETHHLDLQYIKLEIPSGNFQDEAHHLRKQHLEGVARTYQTPYILTAHHANDLAETVLMRLSRGSNLLGYAGLQPVSAQGDFIYLKPLLSFSKGDLYTYAKNHQIHFFEDASNHENLYTRNRYRKLIVPQMIEENPQFLNKVIQYSNHLNEAFSYIRKQSKKYLSAHENHLLLSTFFLEDVLIQKDIIACLLESNQIEFNQLKLDSILSFLTHSGPNQSFQLDDTLILQRVYQKVSIVEATPSRPFNQVLDLEAFNVLETMGFVTFLDAPSNSSFYEIKLCYNKLALPLVARQRQPGDILEFPYGKKKLKDYYIDHKIPMHIRDRDIVITDQTGRILSVLGRYYNTSKDLDSVIKLRYKRGY